MLGSNMAQLEFVIHMAEDYLDLVMENRSFLAPFIEACLVRLAEVRARRRATIRSHHRHPFLDRYQPSERAPDGHGDRSWNFYSSTVQFKSCTLHV